MDLDIELTGSDATEQTLLDLQSWIRYERIAGLRVEPKKGSTRAGEMGPEWLPILTAVLGSTAVTAALKGVVKSIHEWIEERKKKINIKVKTKGYEFEINAENFPEIQALLDKIQV